MKTLEAYLTPATFYYKHDYMTIYIYLLSFIYNPPNQATKNLDKNKLQITYLGYFR